MGIDLQTQIEYRHASLRFFEEGEHHVSRYCEDDVVLLIFEGVLRFEENGELCEVRAGEYYIQKHCQYHTGKIASDAPKYLYVHCFANWSKGENTLSKRGRFCYATLWPLLEEMDKLAHGEYTYTERAATFYQLLSALKARKEEESLGRRMATFLEREYRSISSLEQVCEQFHYSKNHVINLFKRETGITPIGYLHEVKIKRAMYLLEVTSLPTEEIALQSGFAEYSHFYRLFLRRNGVSPTVWRAKIRAANEF